jgi:hypothetical protein
MSSYDENEEASSHDSREETDPMRSKKVMMIKCNQIQNEEENLVK